MKVRDQELIKIIVIQVSYFLLAVATAVLAYSIEGKIDVQGTWGNWKVGGAIGASIVVLLVLISTGPHRVLIKRYKKLMDLPIQVEVVLHPRDKKNYNKLFEGFTNCDFIAYNPAFLLEYSGEHVLYDALQIHIQRYKKDVKSKYLFYDRNFFNRAVKFVKDLQTRALEKNVSLSGNVELTYLPKKNYPQYTYFAGDRSGNPRCILYPGLALREGLPDVVIVIDGDSNLLQILMDHFNRQLTSAQKIANSEKWIPQ